jgi:hypothetical protein
MSRDDSGLYTGLTSASLVSPKAEEIEERKKLDKQERTETRHKLRPAAEPVLALIDKHKKAVMYVENVAGGAGLTDREAGELLRSQRAIYRFLLTFENEIKIALKEVV